VKEANMTHQLRKLIAAVALTAAMGTANLRAQMIHRAVVSIPVEFEAHGRVLPAGPYSLKPLDVPGMIVLMNDDNGQSIFLHAFIPTAGVGHESKLVFRRYDNTYFLAEIWLPWESDGHRLTPGKRELELQARTRLPERGTLIVVARK
jgi:hypothetical protein